MAAKNRIVQFYEKYSDKGKPFTVQHFMEEGWLSRRTIYRTLQTFKERGTTKRKRWKWKARKDIDQTKTCTAVSKIGSRKIE